MLSGVGALRISDLGVLLLDREVGVVMFATAGICFGLCTGIITLLPLTNSSSLPSDSPELMPLELVSESVSDSEPDPFESDSESDLGELFFPLPHSEGFVVVGMLAWILLISSSMKRPIGVSKHQQGCCS